ncbi:hypothetical protein [Alkalibacillus aidingensis]|uniref:hypothetical protein n=1 Tax=Alkalibacillus aidingensis TaxID=2747607 RepID=UPI001660172E|nr:hypothetical protein [Alkalibacillus aidingensis]
MNIALGKDEEVTSKGNFITNLVLAWLKTDFSLTNKRFIGFQPNTLLGVFPLGKKEISYPLKNIASVGVSTQFHLKRFILGLILVFIGLAMFGDSFLGGLILLAVGILPLLNSFTTTMGVTNNAGQVVNIEMSILEKDKVQQFINEVNIAISDAA